MTTDYKVPFPPSCALNKELLSVLTNKGVDDRQSRSRPGNKPEPIDYVPGNPRVSLLPKVVYNYLSSELETPLLDEVYEKLWFFARKDGYRIDTLHTHQVKGRNIIPTEDSRLHLIWSQEKIFVKPIPECLFNHEFWARYLCSSSQSFSAGSFQILSEPTIPVFDHSVTIGFLRSYACLIKYQLDFAIAKELHLIPEGVDWIQWAIFIGHFHRFGDQSVAKRYHFGQLRLSRLNWVVRIFRPKHAPNMWFYETPYSSTTDFISKATIPLAFWFASVSLALSSMQVALAVPEDILWFQSSSANGLREISRIFWIFSIAVVLLWVAIWVLLLGIPLFMLSRQGLWSLKNRELQRAKPL